MPSAEGEAPWLRRSNARTRWHAASCWAIDRQLPPEPNSPCRITTGGPVPYSVAASWTGISREWLLGCNLRPDPVSVDKSPIDVEAEAWTVPNYQMTVAQLRVLAEETEGQRIGLRSAVGFDAKDAARQRENQMTMQLRRGMRRDHRAVLRRQLRDAQRFGETGGARRVELDVTDAALDNKVAYREAGQFTLAVRQRDRRRSREARKIGGLQIPVQWLLEPENPVRFDCAGKLDAIRQIVGRIHVQHQQGLIADRSAHRPAPIRLIDDSAPSGLELDRAVAEVKEARQLCA